MMIVTGINWNSRSARLLGVFFTGAVLGLLWSLSDFAFMQRFAGWIVFAVLGTPLYFIAEAVWAQALSQQIGERISSREFSWKRVAQGLGMSLGILLVASSFYFAIRFL